MMTLGFIVVGILIASAIAANAPHTRSFDWVRATGFVAYVVALILAVVLIADGVRRRRRERRVS